MSNFTITWITLTKWLETTNPDHRRCDAVERCELDVFESGTDSKSNVSQFGLRCCVDFWATGFWWFGNLDEDHCHLDLIWFVTRMLSISKCQAAHERIYRFFCLRFCMLTSLHWNLFWLSRLMSADELNYFSDSLHFQWEQQTRIKWNNKYVPLNLNWSRYAVVQRIRRAIEFVLLSSHFGVWKLVIQLCIFKVF